MRKATINFAMSVRLSVRMEQHSSHQTELYKILHLSISRKIARDNSRFTKIGKDWCTLHMKTNIHF
jgi:hypothetical protein